MPSANKTPNYELNQWQGNEYPKRQDFVDDNAKIDAALKENADTAADSITKSLATAANQFLVSSGVGIFVVKTVAEIKTLLGLGSAAYTNSSDYETPTGAQTKVNALAGAGNTTTVKAVADDLELHESKIAAQSVLGHVKVDGTTIVSTDGVLSVGKAGVKNNYTATTAPTEGDDSADGYAVGSEWIDIANDKSYKCLDATIGSAVWQSYTIATSTTFKRYGFRRERGNSDPAARITYLYDAVGLTPAYMNTGTGNFDYGGWQTFINEVSRPVMLKTEGTVDYELSRTDFTKKSDGVTASDVSNTAYAGNAMIEFRKYKWVYRYSDATYDYVVFCNEQYDSNYKAYAHTNANGNVQSAFYWGAFKGSIVSNKLRSLADQAIMVSQTRNTEVSYAQANGSGYYTIYKSGWDFICDLLTLISKSDNSQDKFGTGRNASSSALSTGTLKGQPQFKGYSDNTSDVKVFGIEGFWGNVWEGMAGLVLNSGIKTKMTPNYNFDGDGYTATGITPSGTSGGYVSSAQALTDQGYVPSVANGSASTYFCDGLWYNNGQVDYALVGGAWGDGLLDGSRYVSLDALASSTGAAVGSRLSFINPA